MTLQAMTRGIAPVAPHLSEELYSFSRGIDPATTACDSVLTLGWFEPDLRWHQYVLCQMLRCPRLPSCVSP